MQNTANMPEEYIAQLSDERKPAIEQLCRTIRDNLPAGFDQAMQYGMISFVVPFSVYPQGYHVNPKEPLPYMAVASQKQHISLYHMGLAMFLEVLEWFKDEYPKNMKTRLDMGKSCIRFRDSASIPYALIGKLCQKITVDEYIARYEALTGARK